MDWMMDIMLTQLYGGTIGKGELGWRYKQSNSSKV